MIARGMAKESLFQKKRKGLQGGLQGAVAACRVTSSSVSIFACESLSFLYTSVINIAATVLFFLISLPFPVNCSYLNT